MRSHHVGRTAPILRENVKLPRPTTCAPSDAAIRLGVAAERSPGRSAFLDFEGMSLFPTAWRILHHTLITVFASLGGAVSDSPRRLTARIALANPDPHQHKNVVYRGPIWLAAWLSVGQDQGAAADYFRSSL